MSQPYIESTTAYSLITLGATHVFELAIAKVFNYN